MRFTATETFFSEKTQSQYVKGLSYTAEPVLRDLVRQWISEGKVREGDEPRAALIGR